MKRVLDEQADTAGYAIARLIAHLNPREMRQALERAFANAVAADRNAIVRFDLPTDVLIDDEDTERNPAQNYLH